jgi:flagellar motor protein MotB
MDIKTLLEKLRKNSVFKKWHSDNKDSVLVHLFVLLEPGVMPNYDIGFYDFKKELMTSFTVDENVSRIELNEAKEIFKEEGQKIVALDEKRIKTNIDEAVSSSLKLQREKYSQHEPMKQIVILQNIKEGQVWNITFVTKSFKTLNIKLDSETGKVVEDKIHELFSMG